MESHSTQDKDQIISRLETRLQEHRTLYEKYEQESISKENVITQMRTKLETVETELQNVREDSKVREMKEPFNMIMIMISKISLFSMPSIHDCF